MEPMEPWPFAFFVILASPGATFKKQEVVICSTVQIVSIGVWSRLFEQQCTNVVFSVSLNLTSYFWFWT